MGRKELIEAKYNAISTHILSLTEQITILLGKF